MSNFPCNGWCSGKAVLPSDNWLIFMFDLMLLDPFQEDKKNICQISKQIFFGAVNWHVWQLFDSEQRVGVAAVCCVQSVCSFLSPSSGVPHDGAGFCLRLRLFVALAVSLCNTTRPQNQAPAPVPTSFILGLFFIPRHTSSHSVDASRALTGATYYKPRHSNAKAHIHRLICLTDTHKQAKDKRGIERNTERVTE